jgi:hypothetical protein
MDEVALKYLDQSQAREISVGLSLVVVDPDRVRNLESRDWLV